MIQNILPMVGIALGAIHGEVDGLAVGVIVGTKINNMYEKLCINSIMFS